MPIYLYKPTETSFATNGLWTLMPTECTVTEIENGLFEAELTHAVTIPETDGHAAKWARLEKFSILSIPMPTRVMPKTITDSNGVAVNVPPYATQQLFRVVSISKTDEEVTVRARHISYDFGCNLLGACELQNASGHAALSALLSALYMPLGAFAVYTDIVSAVDKKLDWTRLNPTMALYDPDDGFCEAYTADALRDNYTTYLLTQAGADRGYTIAYGKNLTGIDWQESIEELVTRLLPVGSDAEGNPLLLPELYVDSGHINDYPLIMMHPLDVPDAQVGGETDDGQEITLPMAQQMLRDACAREYANGIDIPETTITITFIDLGDTEEYAALRHLQQVSMHDTVHIQHSKLGLSFAARVTQTEWDAVRERYTGIEISSKRVSVAKSQVAGWQIPSGVDGGKIRASTITSLQLADSVTLGGIDAMPVGTWLPYSGAVPPSSKWLFAEGQALDAFAYPDAYALFGANLPDARKRTLVHQDTRDPPFAQMHGTLGSEWISLPTVSVASGDEVQAFTAEEPSISNVQPSMVVRFIVKVLS